MILGDNFWTALAALVAVCSLIMNFIQFWQAKKQAKRDVLFDLVSKKIGEISQFMRTVFPRRLDSPAVQEGTEKITIELIGYISELRELKFKISSSRYDEIEGFIEFVVSGVNSVIDSIKKQNESENPDVRIVNAILSAVVDDIDRKGKALCAQFS